MLYAGGGYVIEARQEGVKRNTFIFAAQTATLAIALRKPGITMAQRNKVVEKAQEFANQGKKYDYLGAAGSAYYFRYGYIVAFSGISLFPNSAADAAVKLATGYTKMQIDKNASDERADDKFFCSELISRVFTLAGIPIVNGRATDQTPRQIRYASGLQYYGHLIDKKEVKKENSYPSWQKAKIG